MSEDKNYSKEPTKGYLWHVTSGCLVRTRNLKSTYFTELVLNDEIPKDAEDDIQFKFVPKPGTGHFGYIEHVKSGNVIATDKHVINAVNGTKLVLHTRRDHSALFGYDAANKLFFRNSYKNDNKIVWRPNGGAAYPKNGTPLVVSSDIDESSQFYFGDKDGNSKNLYPDATALGEWKLLYAFLTPKIKRTFKETYRMGRSISKSRMEEHAWSISAEYSIGLFKSQTSYKGIVSKTSSQTWDESTEISREITVNPGESVCVWQFTFIISQYNEEISFMSDILADTASIDHPPPLPES